MKKPLMQAVCEEHIMLKLLTGLFSRKKPQIRRHRIYGLLRSLNQHIKTIVAENPAPKSKEVIKQVNELYQLKEDVILKLLGEGHIRVRCEMHHRRKHFYIFRATRELTFHLPSNKNVKAAVERYEESKTVVRPEEGD